MTPRTRSGHKWATGPAADKFGKQKCVFFRTAGRLNHMVVTGDFALHVEAFCQNPHSRMKEKQCLSRQLSEIGPVVASSQMSYLVPKQGTEFPWAEGSRQIRR